ncbi:MAG TPA: OmpH family outer membrane protein [bacterium]
MRFIALLLCFFISSSVWAKDMKIGTVDLQKLFKEYPGTVKAQKKFSAMAERKKKDLLESESDLKDLEKEIKSSSSVLSEKQKKQKADVYKKKAQDLYLAEQQVQNDLQVKEAEMTQTILDEIKGVVATVAKDKGADLVLDSEKTVYVKDGVDLTDAVLKSYKKSDTDSKDDTDSKK